MAGEVDPVWYLLLALEAELLLFAAAFLVLGAIDEWAMDLCWAWLKLTGRIADRRFGLGDEPGNADRQAGPIAVFVPAWHEAAVIGTTLRGMIDRWPATGWRVLVGCYPNDPDTIAAVRSVADDDPRVALVLNALPGPTTKADCLNTLWVALLREEEAGREPARMIVLHDAEDWVHPRSLALMERTLYECRRPGLVQLPVRPEPVAGSRFVSTHYCDEFAESHAKAMVVRDALGAAVPSAGVGCAIARPALKALATKSADSRPFHRDSLTEDYELGLRLRALGFDTRFVRARDEAGTLIATRSCFPAGLQAAVRQKARWVHGIALQSWDRLGWTRGAVDLWMRARDRRGPLTALVLLCAYLGAALWLVRLAFAPAIAEPVPGAASAFAPALTVAYAITLASLAWRVLVRAGFTTSEYGLAMGLLSVPRLLVANAVAILAGLRALWQYAASFAGRPVAWTKTEHGAHPGHQHEVEGA